MSKTIKAPDVPDETVDKLERFKERYGLEWKGVMIKVAEILEGEGYITEKGDA